MALDKDENDTMAEFALKDLDEETKRAAIERLKSMRRIPSIPVPYGSHLGLFGGTGTGKSRDALQLARRIQRERLGHVFYFDWKFDVENIQAEERFLIPDDLNRLHLDETEEGTQFAIVYSDNDPDIMAHFARTVFRAKRSGNIKRPVFLFFDEIHAYQLYGDNTPVLQVFWQGRGMGIHGVAITPRPQDVHKAIMDNCYDGLVFGRIKRAAVKRMDTNYDIQITPEIRMWWAMRTVMVKDPHHPNGEKPIYPNKVMFDDALDDFVLIDEGAETNGRKTEPKPETA